MNTEVGMIGLGKMGAKYGATPHAKRAPMRRLQQISETSTGLGSGGRSRGRFSAGLRETTVEAASHMDDGAGSRRRSTDQ
jgi:hypothetical protein